jgi:hypothetical protein
MTINPKKSDTVVITAELVSQEGPRTTKYQQKRGSVARNSQFGDSAIYEGAQSKRSNLKHMSAAQRYASTGKAVAVPSAN